MEGRPAVFLDRDGVIIENAHYLSCLQDVRLIPGAAEAIRRLNDASLPVVVVTNQSGVARGLFPESFVAETHGYLERLLADFGARVDAWYHCPHHPEVGLDPYRRDCDCRKPRPGMIRLAARDLDLDPTRSWLIGDNLTDCAAGAAAGCRTILVRTGHGGELELHADAVRHNIEAIVDALPQAVDVCLERRARPRAA